MVKGKFKKWLDSRTLKQTALDLGVTERGVQFWKQGVAVPRPSVMHKIVKLTKGSVGYEDIITHCAPKE